MFVLAYRLFWKILSLKEEMLHKYSDFKLLLKNIRPDNPWPSELRGNSDKHWVCDHFRWYTHLPFPQSSSSLLPLKQASLTTCHHVGTAAFRMRENYFFVSLSWSQMKLRPRELSRCRISWCLWTFKFPPLLLFLSFFLSFFFAF